MRFVYPYFLWAFGLIVIPLALHLFNLRRYKKVYFSNVRMLEDVAVLSKKTARLKHLLILLARILAMLSLVLAFAQPYFPLRPAESHGTGPGQVVSVYLDNSYSMQGAGTNGVLLEEAIAKAREIAGAYRLSTRFHLLYNGAGGVSSRLLSRDEFLESLTAVSLSPRHQLLSNMISRQREMIQEHGGSGVAYVISDFQKVSTDIGRLQHDTLVDTYLVPVFPAETANMYIDSCWFESPVRQPGQQVELNVSIVNLSEEDVEKMPVKVYVDGQQKATASVAVRAHDRSIVRLAYTLRRAGLHTGYVEIDDSPVVYDNRLYFSYSVRKTIRVLCVYERDENPFLKALYGGDSAITLTTMTSGQINYGQIQNQDLIVLSELGEISSGFSSELQKFVAGGGSLCVILPGPGDLAGYHDALRQLLMPGPSVWDTVATTVDYVQFEHPLFRDVFDNIPDRMNLPKVYSGFQLQSENRERMTVLLNGVHERPLLLASVITDGPCYLLTSPLDERHTSLPRHALFVPVFYRMALLGHVGGPLYYRMGVDNLVRVHTREVVSEVPFKIKSLTDNLEFIPEMTRSSGAPTLKMHHQLTKVGNYMVTLDGGEVQPLSLNDDRRESDLTHYSISELEDQLLANKLLRVRVFTPTVQPLGQTIDELQQGVRIWKYFLVAGLLLLLTETALLRFWK